MDIITDYVNALVAGDREGLAAVLAESVRLLPPGIERVFQGRAVASDILARVSHVSELHFVKRLTDGERWGLVFEGCIGAIAVQGLDYVHVDDTGKIDSVTVLIRPLTAMHAFAEGMDREIQKLGHGGVVGTCYPPSGSGA